MAQVTETGPDSAGETVLVPVDFSTCSEKALLYACHQAEHTSMRLLVLHVVHDSAYEPGRYRNQEQNHLQLPIGEIASEMLENWLHELRKQAPELQTLQTARTRVVSGLPGKRIIEVAGLENASRIIMGTHDCHGLSRLLHGSVADYVSKHAKVPVTSIKEGVKVPKCATPNLNENLNFSCIPKNL